MSVDGVLLAVAADPAGGGRYRIHVGYQQDGGGTWATFDDSACNPFGPSVAVSGTGQPGLAFTDFCANELRFLRSNDYGQTWSLPGVIATAPWGAALLLDASDKANVAWVYDGWGMDWLPNAVYFAKEN